MKKTALLFILMVLVCAPAAFFLWKDAGAEELSTTDAVAGWWDDEVEGAEADADDPGNADELLGEGTELEEEEPAESVPEELEAVARAELEGAEGDTRELVVQVFAGQKDVPAAGAEVFFAEIGGDFQPRGANPLAQHWSEQAIHKGLKFTCDEQGRVKLPPVQGSAMVTARRPGEYGFTVVRRRHRDVETILIVPDETVNLRVVDTAGKGVARVPVGVHQRVPQRGQGVRIEKLKQYQAFQDNLQARLRQGRVEGQVRLQVEQDLMRLQQLQAAANKAQPPKTRLELRVRRQTGPEGRAAIKHFQLYRRNPKKGWRPEDHSQFQASLLLPLRQAVATPFAGRPVPSHEIELQLPATGQIALRMVDGLGRPFPHPVTAELRQQGEGVVSWSRITKRKEQAAKTVEFPLVGLGLEFRPHLWLDDRSFRWDGPVFAGPTESGQRVLIDVPVAPKSGMLSGHLLGVDGRPLAGARPTFLITGRAGRLEREDLTLDAKGGFHLPYKLGRHLPPYALEIRYTRAGSKAPPPAGLMLRLQNLVQGKCTDLGQLQLKELDRIAYGMVFDDQRKPIANAAVQLQRHRELGGKTVRWGWRNEELFVSRSDASGKYELFGKAAAGRYRLQAQARAHFPYKSPELAPGRKLDLSLERTASLVGSLLMPAWLPRKMLRLELESAANPRQRRQAQVHEYKGKKRIFLRSVRPGIYNLLVKIRGFPDPLLRVDGILVQAGDKDPHPMLRDLDLSSLVYRYQISAVDDRGTPIKPTGPLLAGVLRPGGKVQFVGFPWRGSKIEVFGISPQMEVWQLAFGFRAQRTMVHAGQSQLQFVKIPEVVLVMPGIRALVGEKKARVSMLLKGDVGLPASLGIRDQHSGRSRGYNRGQLSKGGGAWLGKTDEVQVALMRDGKYQVMLRLQERGAGSVPIDLGEVDVKLVPGAGPFVVQMQVDPGKVQAALAELARRKAAWEERRRQRQQQRQRRRRGR